MFALVEVSLLLAQMDDDPRCSRHVVSVPVTRGIWRDDCPHRVRRRLPCCLHFLTARAKKKCSRTAQNLNRSNASHRAADTNIASDERNRNNEALDERERIVTAS